MAYTGPYPVTFTGTATAMVVSNTTFTGGITNSGKITPGGITVENASSITGNIVDTGTIAGGIIVADTKSTINSAGTGIFVDGTATFGGGITNNGRISAAHDAIDVSHVSTFTGGISNAGTMSVGSGYYGIDASQVGSFGGASAGGGIANSGTISGAFYGIWLVNDTTGSGSISNSGTISASEDGIVAEAVSTFAGDISNSGTITAGGDGIYVTHVTQFGSASAAGSISNSGTITGTIGIDLFDDVGVVDIFDSGSITGSTDAIVANPSAGVDDTLTLAPGYDISGTVDYSAGSNILQLGGSGSGSFNLSNIGSQYLGFATFDAIGGDWTLSGAGNENWTLEAGTLVLSSGASISDNVTFAGIATLQFDSGTNQIGGDIVGAAAGDDIDLRFQSFAAGDHAVWSQTGVDGGILSLVSSTGTTLDTLDLTGGYGPNQFTAVSDNDGGTLIETAAQPPNSPPPAGTTADMIMSNPDNGDYEIYNIGGNQVLAAYPLGQVGSNWSFAAMGTFQAGDTSDMLLRNTSTGQFEAYYISNNTITNAADVGTVGLNWNFAGVGDFDGQSSLSELLLRNADSGAFELYQVAGGGVLSGSSVGAVGGNFTVEGFGHFSESSTTQMLMEGNSGASAGQLELYTYQSSGASFAGIDVGKVGSNLTFLGCADLLGNGSTQMVMQQNNGDIWLYTYNSGANALSGTEVGAIGSNFHVVGFGPLGTSGQDEMLMQNASNGDFEVYQYNASENAFVGSAMGAVGSPWTVDGIAPASATSGSTAQLVQAMASMGGGASISSPANPPAALQTTPQTLLATPQHA